MRNRSCKRIVDLCCAMRAAVFFSTPSGLTWQSFGVVAILWSVCETRSSVLSSGLDILANELLFGDDYKTLSMIQSYLHHVPMCCQCTSNMHACSASSVTT